MSYHDRLIELLARIEGYQLDFEELARIRASLDRQEDLVNLNLGRAVAEYEAYVTELEGEAGRLDSVVRSRSATLPV